MLVRIFSIAKSSRCALQCDPSTSVVLGRVYKQRGWYDVRWRTHPMLAKVSANSCIVRMLVCCYQPIAVVVLF